MQFWDFLHKNYIPIRTQLVEGWEGHPKSVQLRMVEEGGGYVTSHVYVHTYTISFHVFGNVFVL